MAVVGGAATSEGYKHATIEMHGMPVPTHGLLAETAMPNDLVLVVQGDFREWAAGAEVVVGATEYPVGNNGIQVEKRVIERVIYSTVTQQSRVLLTQPLRYRHFAGTVEGRELRAAVGYLKRNVIFTSAEYYYPDEPATEDNKFGRRRRGLPHPEHSVGHNLKSADHGAALVVGGSIDGEKLGKGQFSYVLFDRTGQ